MKRRNRRDQHRCYDECLVNMVGFSNLRREVNGKPSDYLDNAATL
ncbi:MAG: exoribonuclease II [Psychroserpens sp.]|jgi:exoribonuclease II